MHNFFWACYVNNIIGLPCVQYEVTYTIWSPLEVYLNKINKFHFKLMRRTMTQGSFLLDFKFCGVKICTLNIGNQNFLIIMSQLFF